MKTLSFAPPERLEARIAPAGFTFNYTDIDGDAVTLKVSKGSLADAIIIIPGATHTDGPLWELSLIGFPEFDGADISVKVKPARDTGFGDGLANVGWIAADGLNLGKVTIQGTLSELTAGAGAGTMAVKSLTVAALAPLDSTFGSPLPLIKLTGSLGALTVKTNVEDDQVVATGSIGPVKIGGSLVGTDGAVRSGLIWAQGGSIGPVKIGGNIAGGAGEGSGQVIAATNIGPVTVGGSLLGGSANYTGWIVCAGTMGAVKIGRDIVGGGGTDSGSIQTNGGDLAGVTIGGALLGGTGSMSGTITTRDTLSHAGSVGAIRIGGDLRGGDSAQTGVIDVGAVKSLTIGASVVGSAASNTGKVLFASAGSIKIAGDLYGGGNTTGFIVGGDVQSLIIGGSIIGGTDTNTGDVAVGRLGSFKLGGDLRGGSVSGSFGAAFSGCVFATRIGSAFIGGSIVAGTDTGSAFIAYSAEIAVGDDIGSLEIRGGLVGNNAGKQELVTIVARGQENPRASADLAIGRIAIGGSVELAQIIAGDAFGSGTTLDADAQIGAVSVRGDWFASTLAAGAATGADSTYGTSDDGKLTGGKDDPAVISKIARVTIAGQAQGTAANDAQCFGIEAGQIGAVKINGVAVALAAGSKNDLFPGKAIGFTPGTKNADGADFHLFEF